MPSLPFIRKIACAGAVASILAAVFPAAGAAAAPVATRPPASPRLIGATASQAGQDLILTVRTAKPLSLAKLQPRPDTRRAAAAYLCFGFAPKEGAGGAAPETRLCFGGPK